AGGGQKLIKGDVDGSGAITAFDLAAAKKGLAKGFGNKIGELAADVDENGTVEVVDIVQLAQFVMAKIDKFTIAEKPIPPVDTAAMQSLFAGISPATSYKKLGNGNPCMTQRFGADPGAMEYNGRVYIYTTNDAFEYDNNGNLKENSYDVATINCMSSDDLVNWTDHGPIPVARQGGAASWAWASWAPCAAHKTINGQEKFFLYFANSAGGIGVLTADSPTGPWRDPLGHALVTTKSPNCSNVIWMFDPAVMVDSDGQGILAFGGGVPSDNPAHPNTARIVLLGDDMISLKNTPAAIDAPYLFEDSGINKFGNTYYYNYCTNFNTGGNNYGLNAGEIAYMTSSNPMGPYTYQGVIFKNPSSFGSDFGGGGNNHHTIVTFNNKNYLFYHARSVEKAMGIALNYRSTHVNELTLTNGKINSVIGTMKGVAQLKKLNPYETIQAETIYRQAGTGVRELGDTIVTNIEKGDWISIAGADFYDGAKSITMRVSSQNGAAVKICTGSENGTVVGYVDVPATGGQFVDVIAPVSGLAGSADVYFIFSGQMEVDSYSFAS
ncbi:MAG: family 43 glycosylhydrolase, partial [Oscillospiraceae bacterium]|nr:family 43 glycosylhydrolase [Oscillospiraceae bacterium]